MDREATAGGAIIGMITSFLAYVIGGCVAGIVGPLNGAKTAVFVIIVGIVLASVLAIGDQRPISGLSDAGVAGSGFLVGLVLLVVNILGGYLGGPYERQTSSRVR